MAAIGPVSRVAAAEDGVVVVAAAVVAVARETAPWVHPPTAPPKAAENASTRSRRSAVKDKVIAAASRWPTDTIISTSTVKAVTPIMPMKAMSTGKSNTHTDRVTLAAPSNPNAPRSSHASRKRPANHASLGSRANLGKPVSLANRVSRVSHAQSNKSRPPVSRNSTIHNSVRARDRQSSRRSNSVLRLLSRPTRVRRSPSSYGPRPRRATDATSNVS